MNRRVEKYFPDILKMVNKEFYEEIKGQGIPSEYKGYISTFGAMVIQNGLIPALAYFEKNDANEKGNRKRISNIVKNFLKVKDIIKINDNKKLCQYLSEEIQSKRMVKDKLREIENKVIDISIAIKLALRTFLEEK